MKRTKKMMFVTLMATTVIAMMMMSKAFAAPLVPSAGTATCPKSTTYSTITIQSAQDLQSLQQLVKSCSLNQASCTTPACKAAANACQQAQINAACKQSTCTGSSCPTGVKAGAILSGKNCPKATVTLPTAILNGKSCPKASQPTATVKPQPTTTVAPQPTATVKPQPTATVKPQPTATATVKPTATATATATPRPTATPVSGNMSAEESKMINLVNQERTKAGLQALTFDSTLRAPALAHSQDMSQNNYFSHTSPTYGDFSTRLKASGVKYTSAGENLAMYGSVEAAHEGLMNSPGHRANIMNANFTRIGIGIVYNSSKGAYYITQWFAR